MTTGAHLARIQLNPHSRDVQRDLRDAVQMHKTLMRLVPDNLGDTPRREAGLLYRIDENEDTTVLLVQAHTALDPAHLPRGYGHTDVKPLTPMFTALRKDLTVRYRVTVNACKRQRLPLNHKGQRGRIIPLSGADADQWWTRRATEAGLHLNNAFPTPVRPATSSQKAQALTHSLIRYDGTATVTDPDALSTALLTGIGRGKSYGAGLLSLAPAR